MEINAFLNTPVADLPVSIDFYRQTRIMGFERIGEIVSIDLRELMEKEQFTYRWFDELVSLLKANNAAALLQR